MREEKVINLWEVIPEDEHSHISNKIWEALDRAGIELSQAVSYTHLTLPTNREV